MGHEENEVYIEANRLIMEKHLEMDVGLILDEVVEVLPRI